MAGTLVANTINTDTGLFSTNNAYSGIAKAWVYFTGSTGTVVNSFNVSSVTRNSTGNYTVNYTTSMPNANYAFLTGGGSGTTATVAPVFEMAGTPTTSATTFCVYLRSTGATTDETYTYAMTIGS